jgi:hypothetical protein
VSHKKTLSDLVEKMPYKKISEIVLPLHVVDPVEMLKIFSYVDTLIYCGKKVYQVNKKKNMSWLLCFIQICSFVFLVKHFSIITIKVLSLKIL